MPPLTAFLAVDRDASRALCDKLLLFLNRDR
jgi:hypothetical protein